MVVLMVYQNGYVGVLIWKKNINIQDNINIAHHYIIISTNLFQKRKNNDSDNMVLFPFV